MVFLTKILLGAFIATASCRSLLRSQLSNLDSSPAADTDYPLSIQFSSGPTDPRPPPSFEVVAARRALFKLKQLIGPENLKALLQTDIEIGDKAWHDILDLSHDDDTSSDPGNRVLAEVQFTAVPDDCAHATPVNFTAYNFVNWFTDSAFNHVEKLWAGHPEHYFMVISQNEDQTLAADLVEPWGPVLTYSRVPRMAPVTGQPGGGEKKLWMKLNPDFPYQTIGEETLQDGSDAVVGYLHYNFRDIPVGNSGFTCGIEVSLDMWMPSETPDAVKEGIAEHLTIEYYNWVGWAYEDIRSGAYVPV